MINIDNLISEATKNKSLALPIYRLIKAEFLRWKKDNPGKNFDELTEGKILKKMYSQRCESQKIYEDAGRIESANSEKFEADLIKSLLPKEPSDEEIEFWTEHIIESEYNGEVSMKDMKIILSKVREKYPSTTGKIVSKVVKSYC